MEEEEELLDLDLEGASASWKSKEQGVITPSGEPGLNTPLQSVSSSPEVVLHDS